MCMYEIHVHVYIYICKEHVYICELTPAHACVRCMCDGIWSITSEDSVERDFREGVNADKRFRPFFSHCKIFPTGMCLHRDTCTHVHQS